MNGSYDNTLDLAEVSERFLQAEAHLRELAAAAESLSSESAQLGEARQSVQDVAGSVSQLTGTLEGLVEDIQLATQAIQQTDPATIVRRLDEIDTALTEVDGRLQAHTADADDTKRSVESIANVVQRNRTVLLVVTALAAVAAVLAGLGLVL